MTDRIASESTPPKLISIVIPVLNEEDNVERCWEEIRRIFSDLSDRYNYELIFTDNHSSDRTFEILTELAGIDAQIRVLRFSKNFGYQNSILTGLLFAKGAAAVQIDCDMQDPVALIPRFLDQWEQGNKVVYGVRRSRQEGWGISSIRKLFYRLINLMSDDFLPHDAGDFRLIDRVIIEVLRSSHDRSVYLRGAISSFGFQQCGVPYDRQERERGTSKFNLLALSRLATRGIVSHSMMPLRAAIYLAVLTAAGGMLLAISYLISKIWFTPEWTDGFATTTVLILLGFSFLMFFMGILGLYIGRILIEVRRKPLTIIEAAINLDSPVPESVVDPRQRSST